MTDEKAMIGSLDFIQAEDDQGGSWFVAFFTTKGGDEVSIEIGRIRAQPIAESEKVRDMFIQTIREALMTRGKRLDIAEVPNASFIN